MSTYECKRCVRAEFPDPAVFAAHALGVRWWAPASVPEAIAEMVAVAMRPGGYCDRHAALLGAVVEAAIRDEAARRSMLPGTVEVRHVQIEADPFETFQLVNGWKPVVSRVRKFVDGSQLGAIVEIDHVHRRARVTFQLCDERSPQPRTAGIESTRLVHMTASELAAALRDRRAAERVR
jgi:hypothetical protein